MSSKCPTLYLKFFIIIIVAYDLRTSLKATIALSDT